MILYHGTNQIIHRIDLSKGRNRTDFGKGFYLSSSLEVAREWAKARAVFSGKPIVMRYDLEVAVFDDVNINPCKFDTPTVEWLNFVRDNRCRSKKNSKASEPRHNFGIVFGAIANDKVNFVIADYISGLIEAEVAIKMVRSIPNAFQTSIHTPEALAYLDVASAEYQKLQNNDIWSEWNKI